MKNINESSLAILVIRDLIYSFYSTNKDNESHQTYSDLNKFEEIANEIKDLSIDNLYELSRILNISPVVIIHAIDKIKTYLDDYYLIFNKNNHYANDDILLLTEEFFNKISKTGNFIFSSFIIFDRAYRKSYCFNTSSSLLQYLFNKEYREWFDSGAKGIMPAPLILTTPKYL